MISRIKKSLLFLLILGFALSIATPIFAHPGNTDSRGCHTCRTNCPSWGLSYGEYHCHQAKALPQPEEPIKSHYDSDGSGYTEPAPEYKIPAASTASVKNNEGDSSIWGWIIGFGVLGYIVYKFRKKK